jgi:ribA/ribD-fused uncharacterized protein
MASESKKPESYVFFWRTASPFSQWHPAKFTSKSVVAPEQYETKFSCAEQYMMAEKALLFGDLDTYAKIMAATEPRKQKALGRKVRSFKEATWKKWREKIVLQASYAKFSQNEHLKAKLLATGDKILVEASPTDRIWGIGMRASDPRAKVRKSWKGLNLLGYALTEVKRIIKAESG